MQQIFSNTTLTVNQLIEKIDTGELGLPELQRPFIWKDSKVRDLFDSMMCGYPIGYLMLWECPTLEKKKTIGTDTHNYESPKQVIIDGQQRLTSLYAVMKGKKVINSKYDEKSIVISYCPVKNKFEVGYQATKKDPEWIYNISEVFTTSNITKLIINFTKRLDEYRSSKGETLSDEEQDLISENITALSNLKQHTLPVFDIKANAEEEDVSEIFVRVNSGGVALKQNDFILTLLSLYWDEGRKEIEQFSMESTYPSKDKITSYNQLTEVTAQDVIRVVMAYAFDRARLKYGYKLLRGADFDKKGAVDETLRDQRFDVLKAKLPDVLNVHNWHEFLKSIMNAGYLSGDLILSGNAIYYTYIECDQCDNEISFRISGYEYPIGAFNYEDSEITGGRFEEEPHMGVIYSQDDFDLDDAYPAFTRVEQIIMDIAQNRELIYDISPREFEAVIERVLQDEGFETKLTQQTRDGGRDIIATKYEMGKPVVFYIECKRYGRQNSVGVNIVRSLYGVQSADQINKAILVTTGHVTRGARRFVDGQNTMMSVIDVKEIHELIQRNARKYRGY